MEGIRSAGRAGAGASADAGGLQRTSTNNSEQAGAAAAAASVSAASASSYKSPKRYAGEVSERAVAVKPETKSSSGDFTEKSRFVADWKKPGNECSMCGDVGFVQDLLLCKRCGYRLQHTYCSKLYPDLDMETWACEWCVYEEEKNGAAKINKVGKRKSGSLTESRNKAFEFLLQIAQASPSSSSTSRDTKREREGDKRQRENGDTGRPNGISSRKERENGFKCGNGVLKVGNVEQKQVARSSSSLKEENAVKLRHLSENWNCKEENGTESLGHVPKKQRCNHPSEKNKALDKWRNLAKSKLHCNTSKAIGRRYKLLADVLC